VVFDVVTSGSSTAPGLNPGGRNPGGRNALTSSNFKESIKDGFDGFDSFSVFSVALLDSLWNNLGGLGLLPVLLKSGKGPKSFGKSLAKSSCSILDKISLIKLVSVVVLVVLSSILKPGGKNLFTSSVRILDVSICLLNFLGGFLLLKPLGKSVSTLSWGILESKSLTV